MASATPEAGAIPDAEDRTVPGSRSGGPRRPSPWLLAAVAVVLLVGGGAFAFVAVRHRNEEGGVASIRASGLPANVSTSLANRMSLSALPQKRAPAFDLTDQHGRPLSLASLRGRVVVLEFMDSHCHTICPLVSRELVDAHHDLGKAAKKVAFVAVDVNPYFKTTADLAAFSKEHGLDTIPSWRYLTGSMAALKKTWLDYNITIEANGPTSTLVHTSIVYFIGPHGTERYLASPTDDHTKSGAPYLPPSQLASWGRGIALVARDLTK